MSNWVWEKYFKATHREKGMQNKQVTLWGLVSVSKKYSKEPSSKIERQIYSYLGLVLHKGNMVWAINQEGFKVLFMCQAYQKEVMQRGLFTTRVTIWPLSSLLLLLNDSFEWICSHKQYRICWFVDTACGQFLERNKYIFWLRTSLKKLG